MTIGDLSAVRDVPSVTAAQMAEIDRIATLELQIPVDVLMENASRQIAAAARAFLGGSVAGRRVIGLVGNGNNGGDAAGALRHLLNWGARVYAEFTGPRTACANPHDASSPASFSRARRRARSSTTHRKEAFAISRRIS